MKFIAICPKGLEDVTQLEIKDILGVDSEVVIAGRVLFETNKIDVLIVKTQSIIKVYELKQQCKDISSIDTFEIEAPFMVRCSRKGEHEFTSNYVEREVGEKFYNKGYKVSLDNPTTIVFVDIVDDDIFVGIDLTPRLLSKREYRIKVHNQGINACIAYGLVRLSNYSEGKTLLDPFAKDGAVVIEAVNFREGKVFAYESLFPNVRNVEINSKLSGVRKKINISRTEVEWLDTKFKEEEVDCVVSAVPYPSKVVSAKDVEKIYKELFYHLKYILSKRGRAVFIAPHLDLLKSLNEELKIVEERVVGTTNLQYQVIVLER